MMAFFKRELKEQSRRCNYQIKLFMFMFAQDLYPDVRKDVCTRQVSMNMK